MGPEEIAPVGVYKPLSSAHATHCMDSIPSGLHHRGPALSHVAVRHSRVGREGPGHRPGRAFRAHLCTLFLTTGMAGLIVLLRVEHGTGPFGDAQSQGLIHVSGLGYNLGYGAMSPWMSLRPTQEKSSPHTGFV